MRCKRACSREAHALALLGGRRLGWVAAVPIIIGMVDPSSRAALALLVEVLVEPVPCIVVGNRVILAKLAALNCFVHHSLRRDRLLG